MLGASSFADRCTHRRCRVDREPFRLLLAKNGHQPNAAKLFIDYVLSEESQRFMASLGRTVVRTGVKNKYPQLVDGVKLYPVKPDIGKDKDYEELSKSYYGILNR